MPAAQGDQHRAPSWAHLPLGPAAPLGAGRELLPGSLRGPCAAPEPGELLGLRSWESTGMGSSRRSDGTRWAGTRHRVLPCLQVTSQPQQIPTASGDSRNPSGSILTSNSTAEWLKCAIQHMANKLLIKTNRKQSTNQVLLPSGKIPWQAQGEESPSPGISRDQ